MGGTIARFFLPSAVVAVVGPAPTRYAYAIAGIHLYEPDAPIVLFVGSVMVSEPAKCLIAKWASEARPTSLGPCNAAGHASLTHPTNFEIIFNWRHDATTRDFRPIPRERSTRCNGSARS